MTKLQPAETTMTARYLLDVRRFMMWALGIFVLSGVAVLLGILPQSQESLKQYQQLRLAQAKVKQLQTKNRQLADVLDPSLQGQIDTVGTLLPSHKPLLELLNTMNAIGQQTEVKFVSIELTPGSLATPTAAVVGNVKTAGADSLKITLNVEGTLSQINRFFTETERSTPLTTMTSLSLSPENGKKVSVNPGDTQAVLGETRYRADVTMAASFFTQSVTANVSAALPTLTADQTKLLSDLQTFVVNRIDPQTQIVGGGLQDLFKAQNPQVTTIGSEQPFIQNQ